MCPSTENDRGRPEQRGEPTSSTKGHGSCDLGPKSWTVARFPFENAGVMNQHFWDERWRAGQTGFHLSEVNPNLVRHHERLGPANPRSRVLVPLCGKSIDLAWLAARGHDV